MNIVKAVNDPRFYYACHAEKTGRAASVTKEALGPRRFIVTGTWNDGRDTMELAEINFDVTSERAAASEACKFANRWARGVSR